MKILIIGILGSGKSTLAYYLSKKYNINRLNLDEVSRNPQDGSYRNAEEIYAIINSFTDENSSWIMEGSQKDIYSLVSPDLIVYMKIPLWLACLRFTRRFFQAKKLIGKDIDADLPVQAYHYRKITLDKIRDWNNCNRKIKNEIENYLKNKLNYIFIKNKKDYAKIERRINEDI